MAHTPGPWKVISRIFGYSFPTLRVWTAAEDAVADLEICTLNPSEEYNGQRLADARLIAAAPDLLEAAKHVAASANLLTARGIQLFGMDELRAAIAKAEGK